MTSIGGDDDDSHLALVGAPTEHPERNSVYISGLDLEWAANGVRAVLERQGWAVVENGAVLRAQRGELQAIAVLNVSVCGVDVWVRARHRDRQEGELETAWRELTSALEATLTPTDLGDCGCCNRRPAFAILQIWGVPASTGWCEQCWRARVLPMWVAVRMVGMAPNGLQTFNETELRYIERTLTFFGLSYEELALVAAADGRGMNRQAMADGATSEEEPCTGKTAEEIYDPTARQE